MHPFDTLYNSVVVPRLTAQTAYPSSYLIPKVKKVIVNVGVGDCVGNSKALEEVIGLVTQITGQKPVTIKARKAISGFKIRENMVVGLKVTLRGVRMNDFLYKLIQVVLPRTRDFRGLPATGITADGNLNIGIKDSMIFPEISQSGTSHGIQVTIVSTASSQETSRQLYEAIGFVFQKPEDATPTRKRK
jgi:large subunit ribosomal protein L5